VNATQAATESLTSITKSAGEQISATAQATNHLAG
jgi:hypothetical protein